MLHAGYCRSKRLSLPSDEVLLVYHRDPNLTCSVCVRHLCQAEHHKHLLPSSQAKPTSRDRIRQMGMIDEESSDRDAGTSSNLQPLRQKLNFGVANG